MEKGSTLELLESLEEDGEEYMNCQLLTIFSVKLRPFMAAIYASSLSPVNSSCAPQAWDEPSGGWCVRMVKDVTMPKFGPAPATAQNRSGYDVWDRLIMSPVAVTRLRDMRLSTGTIVGGLVLMFH